MNNQILEYVKKDNGNNIFNAAKCLVNTYPTYGLFLLGKYQELIGKNEFMKQANVAITKDPTLTETLKQYKELLFEREKNENPIKRTTG